MGEEAVQGRLEKRGQLNMLRGGIFLVLRGRGTAVEVRVPRKGERS